MKALMISTKKGPGFTLIELIVVIAIIGVLAAVATPMITNYLSDAKSRSYDADQALIQTSVDSFYSAPDNVRFIGKRQYPLIGKGQTNQSTLQNRTTSHTFNDNGNPFSAAIAGVATTSSWNPLGGTQGADISTKWTDGNTDGVRAAYATSSADTWGSVSVTRGGVTYHTDPRYYFIDFEALVSEGILEAIPESASPDNKPSGSTSSYTGNYSWYVDNLGHVASLDFNKPSTKGYVSGQFP